MVFSITRRLLRDWKHINRSLLYINPENQDSLFYLKPQDSNLHIWHLILIEPLSSTELYFILYINELFDSEVLLVRCLTPYDNIPFNRNINLSYLFPIFKEHGLHQLILKIWNICFGQQNNYKKLTSDAKDSNIDISSNTQYVTRMLRAWNRIMYKDFKIYFPELVGFLQPGDYESVKALSKRLKDYKYGGLFQNQLKGNKNSSTEYSLEEEVPNITTVNMHTYDNNSNIFSPNNLYTCDNIISLKRKKLNLEDIGYNNIDKSNNSNTTGDDSDTLGTSPQSKRRKL